MDACSYCGTPYDKLHQHEAFCLENPEVHDKTRKYLYSKASKGTIMKRSTYKLDSSGKGLPSVQSLENHYGKWADVAKGFGLSPYIHIVK